MQRAVPVVISIGSWRHLSCVTPVSWVCLRVCVCSACVRASKWPGAAAAACCSRAAHPSFGHALIALSSSARRYRPPAVRRVVACPSVRRAPVAAAARVRRRHRGQAFVACVASLSGPSSQVVVTQRSRIASHPNDGASRHPDANVAIQVAHPSTHLRPSSHHHLRPLSLVLAPNATTTRAQAPLHRSTPNAGPRLVRDLTLRVCACARTRSFICVLDSIAIGSRQTTTHTATKRPHDLAPPHLVTSSSPSPVTPASACYKPDAHHQP